MEQIRTQVLTQTTRIRAYTQHTLVTSEPIQGVDTREKINLAFPITAHLLEQWCLCDDSIMFYLYSTFIKLLHLK